MDEWWPQRPPIGRMERNLEHSRLSDARSADPLTGTQEIPLVRWLSPTKDARQWRVTLGPVMRRDGTPAIGGVAIIPGQPIGAVLAQNAPPVARANPVTMHPHFVRLRWGIGEVVPWELIASWPQLGATCAVVADNVQIDALVVGATPQVANSGSVPRFAASIAPDEGGDDPSDNAGLSFAQLLSMLGTGGNGQVQTAVPSFARTLGIRVNQNGTPETNSQAWQAQWLVDDPAVAAINFVSTVNAGQQFQYPVPAEAVSLVIINTGANPATISLEWRISP